MLTEKELILGCIANERICQKKLYDLYASTLLGICARYTKNIHEAEDVLQETFIHIFNKLDTYKFEGSFEGWLKRITVNKAINQYRHMQTRGGIHEELNDDIKCTEEPLSPEHLLLCLQSLPIGYRTIFNLHEIEGYKHKEIAVMLNISINTSKSQLMKSKQILSKKIKP